MADQQQPQTLAERALVRLRRVAEGNGLTPSSLVVFETQEQSATLRARMDVSPMCETESTAYPGPIKVKGLRVVQSFGELQAAVKKHSEEFKKNPDWIDAVVSELKAHENQGWGLQSAKVALPAKSTTYAASEVCPNCSGKKLVTCPTCGGRGTVMCPQCQGRGQEQCYNCYGTGQEPQAPEKPCHVCNGTRFAPCRRCGGRSWLPCPTCNGRRGVPCSVCQGSGVLSQQVSITCGAETHFVLLGDGLPSGLRRGLDRIGIENIAKGHADITVADAQRGKEMGPTASGKIPVIEYAAVLPYAEMKVDFGGKKALVSVVGKRGALSGVPNFLDLTLKPWRDKLRLAAFGQAPLEDALEARALKEIFALTVSGKGRENNVRKLYPFGLSSEAIQAALNDMAAAVKKTTLATRSVIASICFGLFALFFYIFFVRGWETALTDDWNASNDFLLDFGSLAAALAISWVILNFSTRIALQRRFMKMPYALQQKIGKTGLSMLVGIAAAFALAIVFAPLKPLWLASLLYR